MMKFLCFFICFNLIFISVVGILYCYWNMFLLIYNHIKDFIKERKNKK